MSDPEVGPIFNLEVGKTFRTGFKCLVEAVHPLIIGLPLMLTRAAAHTSGAFKIHCSLNHDHSLTRRTDTPLVPQPLDETLSKSSFGHGGVPYTVKP